MCSQLEKEYQEKREKTFPLDYQYASIPVCYDFIINGHKVQEKVATPMKDRPQSFIATLHRSNGKHNSIRQFQPYEKGENDYYWINIPSTTTFYLIPEHALMKEGYIKFQDKEPGKRFLYLNLNAEINWYCKYRHDYKKTCVDKIKQLFES